MNETRYSKLDITLATQSLQTLNINSQTLDDIGSDHLPVIIRLKGPNNTEKPRKILNYKRTDWQAFQNVLNDHLNQHTFEQINSTNDIDNNIHKLESLIVKSVNDTTPLITVNKNNKYKDTEEIRTLKKYRNALNHHIYNYKHNTPPQLHTLRNKLNKTINYLIWEEKQKYVNKTINSLNNLKENEHFWNAVNKLISNNTKNMENVPLKQENGDLAFSTTDKLRVWEKHYTETFSTLNTTPLPEHTEITQTVSNYFRLQPENWPQELLSTNTEILTYIKAARNKSAPGPDGITNITLKHLPERAITIITNIINACLKLHYFPTRWKQSTITSIPKAGKSNREPGNYRPISLISHMGKLLERKVNNHINNIIQSQDILREEQHGFRLGRSAGEAIIRLIDHASLSFAGRRKLPTMACFFDMRKAFDSVWHEALLFRLITYNFPSYISHMIKSYLTNRITQAKVQGTLSNNIHITAGVPQGSILAPTLYILFINTFPNHRISANDPLTTMLNKCRNIYQYADDTTISVSASTYTAAHTELNTWNREIAQYCNINKMEINSNKSTFLSFKHWGNTFTPPPLTYQNEVINRSTSTKFLGVTIDQHLSWKHDLKNRLSRASRFIPVLRDLKRQGASVESLIQIHKSKIRPILTYNPITLGLYCNTDLTTLIKKDRKLLQTICKPLGQKEYIRTHYIFETYKIKPLDQTITEQINKTLNKYRMQNWAKYTHPDSPLKKLYDKYLNIEIESLF